MSYTFTVKANKGLTMANRRDVDVWRGQVRIPLPLMNWIEQRASESYRSLNAEIIEVVRELKRITDAKNVQP